MSDKPLDPLLHQPVRTRLAAYIAARGEATFSELKQALEATDGNLEAHVKKLVAAAYLEAIKSQGLGRPQTLYRLTPLGLQAFHDYVAELQRLLPELAGDETESRVSQARSGMNLKAT
jgi:predicted ArsR family transcriptional regulator